MMYGIACDCGRAIYPRMPEALLLGAGPAVTQRRLYGLQERGRVDLGDKLQEAVYAYSTQDLLDYVQTYHFEWVQHHHRRAWKNP